jgi:mRNA interferase MazF
MAGGPGGASMLPPAVIVQEDGFAETVSIAVCPLTSEPIDAPILRILAEPAPTNGLRNASRLMVDKVKAVPRSRLGQKIGQLSDADVQRLNRSLLVFLGLAR